MEKQLPKKLLPFFIYFLKPYKWWLIALTALGIIWAVQSTLTPYFMKLLVNAISDYNGDNADIFDVIKWPMLGYIVVWILTLTVYRLVDLLLTDIVMPEMDGIDLAQRASELDPDLKIMFITGFAAVALTPDSRSFNSDSPAVKNAKVLSKPFHLRELVNEVKKMLT